MDLPQDPVRSLSAAISNLANHSFISKSERDFFNREANETLTYNPDQDESYALAIGQVNLDLDNPLAA